MIAQRLSRSFVPPITPLYVCNRDRTQEGMNQDKTSPLIPSTYGLSCPDGTRAEAGQCRDKGGKCFLLCTTCQVSSEPSTTSTSGTGQSGSGQVAERSSSVLGVASWRCLQRCRLLVAICTKRCIFNGKRGNSWFCRIRNCGPVLKFGICRCSQESLMVEVVRANATSDCH